MGLPDRAAIAGRDDRRDAAPDSRRARPAERRRGQMKAFLDTSVLVAVFYGDHQQYARTLRSSAMAGSVGGTIYDVLLASCALKAKADALFTWNLRHYAQ